MTGIAEHKLTNLGLKTRQWINDRRFGTNCLSTDYLDALRIWAIKAYRNLCSDFYAQKNAHLAHASAVKKGKYKAHQPRVKKTRQGINDRWFGIICLTTNYQDSLLIWTINAYRNLCSDLHAHQNSRLTPSHALARW
jgi:hypothetical protein